MVKFKSRFREFSHLSDKNILTIWAYHNNIAMTIKTVQNRQIYTANSYFITVYLPNYYIILGTIVNSTTRWFYVGLVSKMSLNIQLFSFVVILHQLQIIYLFIYIHKTKCVNRKPLYSCQTSRFNLLLFVK